LLQASRSEAKHDTDGAVKLQVSLLPFQQRTPFRGAVLRPLAPRVTVAPAVDSWAVSVAVGVPAAMEKAPEEGVRATLPLLLAVRVPLRLALSSLPAGQGTVEEVQPSTVTVKGHRAPPGS
jgi:hypothetical protein